MLDVISECLDDAAGLCTRLQAFAPSLSDLSDRVLHCLQGGHKLMFCGNGGSASDGAHIATGRTINKVFWSYYKASGPRVNSGSDVRLLGLSPHP